MMLVMIVGSVLFVVSYVNVVPVGLTNMFSQVPLVTVRQFEFVGLVSWHHVWVAVV